MEINFFKQEFQPKELLKIETQQTRRRHEFEEQATTAQAHKILLGSDAKTMNAQTHKNLLFPLKTIFSEIGSSKPMYLEMSSNFLNKEFFPQITALIMQSCEKSVFNYYILILCTHFMQFNYNKLY